MRKSLYFKAKLNGQRHPWPRKSTTTLQCALGRMTGSGRRKSSRCCPDTPLVAVRYRVRCAEAGVPMNASFRHRYVWAHERRSITDATLARMEPLDATRQMPQSR